MPDRPRYALGRLPADPTKPKLRLRRAAAERPVPPVACDWLSQVPRWGMLANDSVGCCTASAAAHAAVAVDRYGQDRDLVITDDEVLTMYSAISGYDPARPETDVGATLQDALDYWHRIGVAGNQIAAFAWINPQDLELVRACLATFGSLYAGMWITSAAMDQFDRGQPWTTTSRQSPLLGGHCIHIGAYDQDSFTATTWGRTQPMSVAFLQRWVDEITVPVDLDWLRSVGTSPAGLDVATLNIDYEILTGQPGPFSDIVPLPTPEPLPIPTPEPLPGPDPLPVPPAPRDPDVELVAAFTAWRAAKGL